MGFGHIHDKAHPATLIGQFTKDPIVLAKVFAAGSFAQAQETKNLTANTSVVAAKAKDLAARSFATRPKTKDPGAGSSVFAAEAEDPVA